MVMRQKEQDRRQQDRKEAQTAAGGSEDKEFLRTEPLGKLLLKLALPTVAAQLINMLYNIVDMDYIGHIPDIGCDRSDRCGVCMPLIMIVSAFAASGGDTAARRERRSSWEKG